MNAQAHIARLVDLNATEARRLSIEIGRVILQAHPLVSPSAILTALAHASAGALIACTDDHPHALRRAVGFSNAVDMAIEQIAAGEPASPFSSLADAKAGSADDPTTFF